MHYWRNGHLAGVDLARRPDLLRVESREETLRCGYRMGHELRWAQVESKGDLDVPSPYITDFLELCRVIGVYLVLERGFSGW